MADTTTVTSVSVEIVEGALAQVPYVGHILSELVPTFWPAADNSVWWDVENQVEALIDEKISEDVYNQVNNTLSGLSKAFDDYLGAVSDDDLTDIPTYWIAVKTEFDTNMPQFQWSGYEVLLLPLFAQAVNMYLALLRDGVVGGPSWGWNDATQKTNKANLTAAIQPYVDYAQKYFKQGIDQVTSSTGKNNHDCQPFRTVNAFTRQMILGVADQAQLWPYYDVSAYPNGVTVYLDREIYSDPVGTCDDSGNIVLPAKAPRQPPDQITVWAWDRIDAVQLTYPTNEGPNNVTKTARMGDQSGGSDQAPHGGVFNVKNNPVTIAGGTAGTILNSFDFTFEDGTTTGKLGGSASTGGTGQGFSFSYDGHILSSIHINGVSDYYGSADCAVFGFKYKVPTTLAASGELIELSGWPT